MSNVSSLISTLDPQSAAAVAALPSVGTTVGALFVGWGVSALAFGILCTQSWSYFTNYSNDMLSNKLLVSGVWVIETAHQVLIGVTCWHYGVASFNESPLELYTEKTNWSLSAMVLLGAAISTVVKIFFGLRVYRLSKGNLIWSGLIWSMTMAQLGTATGYSIRSTHVMISQLVTIQTLGTVSLSLGAITDIIIALVLTYYLHTMRTGYRRSDTLINRLIAFSVNTGTLTSLFSLAVVILYQLMPANFVFIACYFVVCKLYSNSCLATLNTRQRSSTPGVDFESSINGTAFHMTPRARVVTSRKSEGQGSLNIDVHREVAVRYDGEKSLSKGSIDEHEGKAPGNYRTFLAV